MTTTTHATIILTGGHGSRLGTTNKAELPLGTTTFLNHILTTLPSFHHPTILVGPPPHTPTHIPVITTQEHPPHTGPLAAIAHATTHLPPQTTYTTILACDTPHAAHAITPLTHALTTTHQDAALAVDKEGRWQPLVAVYDVAALATALDALRDSGGLAHRPVKHLIAALNITTVPLPQLWTFDVDTPQDYSQMRSLTTSERAHTTGEDPDDDAI
ncbi:molybdenum cofactor guanylyltransferase [Jonesia denitrificans]|uniref:Molybdopterin-guanine dinucleotide biosynthesis protein A-like protein n=1 Tax=Jonesia denitrificans (strain ATCC 14870 / DSM 20603 / BCRC 15368 / CIP 55.134 / JCM 11481 / NBRC 15587 / NCTC 10816 / Prevot 55134) TaxID=471856 RepID=C7R444_JONDD|nr:NTP transferase domain-containing protein [Jonesia denitrificans]ACV08901.1 Molybdopterin-guanine dinucleotide biosynthesis protein A-like protein [Jonesia denitrificans DSM 20603]ASE09787.1 hypothetical protein CEP80_12110 [Jonesia denitrificans]QXB44324.1 NTP transferase domain-containing protein [Jonesia denitrificans]SQH20946.1 molybdopterin-guanine dinucleotide biosynthesis protein MobA [Jonesia denitrificans]